MFYYLSAYNFHWYLPFIKQACTKLQHKVTHDNLWGQTKVTKVTVRVYPQIHDNQTELYEDQHNGEESERYVLHYTLNCKLCQTECTK